MPRPKSTNTPGFKRWFGNSVVTENNRQGGVPKRVYHGTTHSFDAFTMDRTNVENFLGRGFYFTDNRDDAAGNYGFSGPDLTNRIESMVDRIMGDEGIGREKALRMAKKELSGNRERVLDVYLRIEKPFWYDNHEFTFSLEIPEDELEEYREEATESVLEDNSAEPEEASDYEDEIMDRMRDMFYDNGYEERLTGDGYEFINLVIRHASGYDDYPEHDPRTAIQEKFSLHNGVETVLASDLMVFLKEEVFPYISDDEGNLVVSEVLRMAIRDLGYDGVVMFPERHFRNMSNVYGTTHYIVFDPRQVKSIYSGWNTESEKFHESKFGGLMGELQLLTEGRDILYHDTSLEALDRILQLDQFELSNSHTNEAEEFPESRGRPYFMSFSRNRANRFRENGGSVTIVVDGSGLRSHHRLVPINYWRYSGTISSEQEERLLSRQPVVRNVRKFIKEIHVYYNPKNVSNQKWILESLSNIEMLSSGIPVYYYTDRKDLYLMDKRKSVKPELDPDIYGPRLYRERTVNDMLDVVEFLETGKTQNRKLRERLRRYWNFSDFYGSISTDFHNFGSIRGIGAREVHRRLNALLKKENVGSMRELLTIKYNQFLNKR